MRNEIWQYKTLRTMILAATPLFCLSLPATAQNAPDQNNSSGAVQSQTGVDRGQSAGTNREQSGAVNQEENVINRDDLVAFDRFLDSHREIREQLRKDPSLIHNRRWVQDHPALQSYLQNHSQLRGAITSDPTAFMRAERGYDFREDTRGEVQSAQKANTPASDANKGRHRDRDMYASNRENSRDVDRDQNGDVHRDRVNHGRGDFDRYHNFDRQHLASFHEFMGQHRDIAREVSQNPDRVNDQRYLNNRPELKHYLNSNPGVQHELASNPQSFVNVAQQVNVSVNVTGTGTSTSGSTSSSTSGSVSGSGSSKTTGTTGANTTGSSTAMVGGTSTKATSSNAGMAGATGAKGSSSTGTSAGASPTGNRGATGSTNTKGTETGTGTTTTKSTK